MKKGRDDITINTIPKGAYEGGAINQELRKDKDSLNTIATDAQGNGYPVTDAHNETGE